MARVRFLRKSRRIRMKKSVKIAIGAVVVVAAGAAAAAIIIFVRKNKKTGNDQT